MVRLELFVDAAQVAAAVRGQERARLLALLAVAEQRAPQPCDPLVPRELAERLGLGNADQLLVLRSVAEIFAVPIDEEIDGRAVDELEATFGDALPVIGRNALAANAAGNRYELQVEVIDAESVDHLADLAYLVRPSGGFHEAFDVHRHSAGLLGLRLISAAAGRRLGGSARVNERLLPGGSNSSARCRSATGFPDRGAVCRPGAPLRIITRLAPQLNQNIRLRDQIPRLVFGSCNKMTGRLTGVP